MANESVKRKFDCDHVIIPEMNKNEPGKIELCACERIFKLSNEKLLLIDNPVGSYTIATSKGIENKIYCLTYKLFKGTFYTHRIHASKFKDLTLLDSQLNAIKRFDKLASSSVDAMEKLKNSTDETDFVILVSEDKTTIDCYRRYKEDIRIRQIKSVNLPCVNLIASINSFLEDKKKDYVR